MQKFFKTDPDTFTLIASDYSLKPEEWIFIDDSPMALWSAKTAGFKTIMMLNSVFGNDDFKIYRKYIDFKAFSFKQILRKSRITF